LAAVDPCPDDIYPDFARMLASLWAMSYTHTWERSLRQRVTLISFDLQI